VVVLPAGHKSAGSPIVSGNHHIRSAVSVAKIIEITSRSDKSFEDAIKSGIVKAGESVHGIREAWVAQQKVVVENNKAVGYQVDLKITFVLD
jgi:hypothetical protein